MEIGDRVTFDGKEYTITDIFAKTSGSSKQRLLVPGDKSHSNVDSDRAFYIALDEGANSLWIKHHLGYRHSQDDAEYEYRRMLQFGEYAEESHLIAPVKVYACENGMILMDYCPYPPLGKLKLNNPTIDIIDDLAHQWTRKYGVQGYDMCFNNTLARIDGDSIELRLIDFERAEKAYNETYEFFHYKLGQLRH